uniref:Uncharacterized protein n=1 Tax=Meloidogyne incognita TaxID=6306 RepID=A0A914NEQ9_MELIC
MKSIGRRAFNGSLSDINVSGRELTIASISQKSVVNSVLVRSFLPMHRFSAVLVTPTSLSQAPPSLGLRGVMNFHSVPLNLMKSCSSLEEYKSQFIFLIIFEPRVKFVALSETIIEGVPRLAMKRR